MRQNSHVVGHIFTFVWYCVAVLLLSLAMYLFLQGSSVFPWNRDRIAVRAHVEQKGDQLLVSGSLTPVDPCVRVHMVESNDVGEIALVATPKTPCFETDHQPITFVAELPLIDQGAIFVSLNGTALPIHFQ